MTFTPTEATILGLIAQYPNKGKEVIPRLTGYVQRIAEFLAMERPISEATEAERELVDSIRIWASHQKV